MDKKSLVGVEIKDETKGEVEAVFATLNVKDRDDDVTLPGAFDSGSEVVISAYGHKSWEGALPVGKGTIQEVGDKVVLKGRFFLNTTAGRDTFEVVKELGARQEWSYGFNVTESEPGEHEGKAVRVLKKMSVFEVSPVMRGAGLGTATTYAKAALEAGYSLDQVAKFVEGKTLNDEISDAVDAVSAAVKSAGRVVALRAEKGKDLSQVNRDRLVELSDACDELKGLLNVKADDSEPVEDNSSYELALIAAQLDMEEE